MEEEQEPLQRSRKPSIVSKVSNSKTLKIGSKETISYGVGNLKKIFAGAAGAMMAIAAVTENSDIELTLGIVFFFVAFINAILEYLHEVYIADWKEGNVGFITDQVGIILRITGGVFDGALATIIGNALVNNNTVSRIEIYIVVFLLIALLMEYISEYTWGDPSVLTANRLKRVLYGKERQDLRYNF